MVTGPYTPERGDIVWLNFDPQAGHEQKGKRPALVLSPREYNHKVGLGLFCPVTSQEKGYPFEVRINNEKIRGVVLELFGNFSFRTASAENSKTRSVLRDL